MSNLTPKQFIDLLSTKLSYQDIQDLLDKKMVQIESIKRGLSDGKDVHRITMK